MELNWKSGLAAEGEEGRFEVVAGWSWRRLNEDGGKAMVEEMH